MARKGLAILAVLAITLGLVIVAANRAGGLFSAKELSNSDGFVRYPLPLRSTVRLFDIGVVDANGDGWLDIYTSNHHFRQALLLADGEGGYRDVLSEWELDQSKFRWAELTFDAPQPDKPGVYVYWLGTNFVVRAHRIKEIGDWHGSLHVLDPVEVVKSGGFQVDMQAGKVGNVTETTASFTCSEDGVLVLRPDGQGLPLDFEFRGAIRPEDIYVGLAKISPKALDFSLAMQDRHAHAWADFNGDGVTDVFINRGALSGTLRAYPEPVARGIRDELFLSQAPGVFEERGVQTGLEKKGCSGRHAQWVDFDGDGLLDLFVNCYDREHVAGDYPKQLYRQESKGVLRDVAEEVGLGLPDQQMANLVWFDVDRDGDADLLAFQDEGLFLYRQSNGSFVRETVVERGLERADRVGQAQSNYWFYDGKFSVADYDGDGGLDVFSSSKRGNILLRNRNGILEAVDLGTVGLPARSTMGNWVDFDNDGRPDLHLVPQGLFRQRPDHTFEETGLLAVDEDRYDAAIVNWADLDNDGRIDILMALDENREFRRWWEFRKELKPRGRWDVMALRNTIAPGHWLQIALVGDEGNRQGIGAMVSVTAGNETRVQAVGASEGSFFSQGHYRLYFGLGPHQKASAIRVRWPDGVEQELRDVAADHLVTIERKAAP